MSINTLVTTNTTNNPRRITSDAFVPSSTQVPPSAYVRPGDWPALDVIGPSDQKMSGLYAVNNTSLEYVGLIITGSGTLTVDWGDGTSNTATSGVAIQKQYNYATLATSVTSRGYKTALINVTTSGTLTEISFTTKPTPVYPNNALPTGWSPKWLDVAVGSPNLARLTIGNTGLTTIPTLMEQFSVISLNNTNYNPGTGLFAFCFSLQSIPSFPIGALTLNRDMNSMFLGCRNLQIAPNIDLSKNTNCFQMFYECSKLQTVPAYNLSNNTNTRLMYVSCSSLKTIPLMDYSLVTTAQRMFENCTSLEYVPNMNFSGLNQSTNAMFNNCPALRTAPNMNTINVSDMSSMFQQCSSLTTVPLYNVANVQLASNMFYLCRSLTRLPSPWNFAKNTTFNLTFGECNNLVEAPLLLNTGLVNDVAQMFLNCYALTSIPLFDTSNVTSFTATFRTCTSLNSIPLFNTAKNISFNFTFANTSLVTIPQFNTINVTNMSSMFNGCKTIQTIPVLNTSNVLNMNSMFSGATGLVTIPAMDLVKVTDMAFMFSTCNSLVSANGLSNTSNVGSMNATFINCVGLVELPPAATFNTSKVTNMSQAFSGCFSLISVPTYNTINVTNIGSSFNSCLNLTTIPPLNLSNVTTAPGAFLSGSNSITSINATGLRVAHSLVGTSIGMTDLENYFVNLGTPASAQTLTITSIPGATTIITRSSGTTANSNVITLSNTVGIFPDMYITAVGIVYSIDVTYVIAPTSTFTYTGLNNNGVQNGDSVIFGAFSPNPGLVVGTQYFVVNRTSTTFQISASLGGSAIALTASGTSPSMSIGGATIANKIVTVNANANVIINGISANTFASTAIEYRALNTNYPRVKRYTIAG